MAKETFSSLIDLFKNSSSSSVTSLVCDECGNKLSVFRKKRPCGECKRQFCSQCLQRCRDRVLRCKSCNILTTRPPLRSALLDLRAKDLQNYLNQHNVSTRGCLEKEDLVNVLLQYAITPGNPPAGNPTPGDPRCTPYGVTRNNFTESSRTNHAGSSGTRSSVNIATSSSSTHISTQEPQLDGAQTAQTMSGHGDSDSSSDTSFEIVQRPSSDENITSVHTSSSSSSVSGNTSQSNPTLGTTRIGPAAVGTERPESESSQENLTLLNTLSAPSQSPVEEAAGALGPISLPSQTHPEVVIAPEIRINSDVSNASFQEAQDISLSALPQPVSQPNSSDNSVNNSPFLLRGTMASITSESDFEALSVKSLKDILHRHRVNYYGCCEKAELVDRAKRLYRDYCSSRAELENLEMDALCKICMDAPVECVMLECGHMATCTECGRQLSECPICRQFVVRVVRTFKA